jgi:signal transduction histidine kinase
MARARRPSVGSGDIGARLNTGGDIAAVARAFNSMAADLAASDRVRRQLLADVSHELKTPVTAISGYLETMTMPELALDDATRARYLGIIGDETRRLERLIGDLLDLARLEAEAARCARTPCPSVRCSSASPPATAARARRLASGSRRRSIRARRR